MDSGRIIAAISGIALLGGLAWHQVRDKPLPTDDVLVMAGTALQSDHAPSASTPCAKALEPATAANSSNDGPETDDCEGGDQEAAGSSEERH